MEAPSAALNYPDSLDSSPRSRNTDSWDDPPVPPPPTTAANKLRFMCSFNGHIVPRPHDKSLCYVGGETRIVVIDRNTPLSEISTRLSKTFLNNRPFTLKYLLPTEDLDSLISVTTDEDLDNLIDEYDRVTNNGVASVKPSRIRLFLFPSKPDSVQSIPVINSSGKSEDWFLGMLNRGFSDSGSVNLLMGFDDDGVSNKDGIVEGSLGNSDGNKSVKQQGQGVVQDVHSVPDSPMLETTSSFGSTSSSPSVANLPPIRVHVDEGSVGNRVQEQKGVGIEDQFAQIGIGGGCGVKQQDEGFAMSSPNTMPVAASGVAMGSSGVMAGEYQNRVVSDDERSEHGVVGGFRKPPTPPPQTVPQPQILHTQLQQKVSGGGVDLPSPDSVSSDSSLTNAMLRPKPVVYQDQAQMQIPSGATRVPSSQADPKLTMSDSHGRIQMQQQMLEQGYVLQAQFDQQQQQQQQNAQQQHQFIHATQQQVQEGGYVLQPQYDKQQQQFVHGTHFIQHAPSGAMPLHTFYPVYPSQQQQQQQLHPQHHHQQVEQQYQIYYVPTRQSQPYNLAAQQPNISEPASTIPSSRAQTTSNPGMVQPSAAYNPIRNAQVPQPEMTAGAYRTAISVTPQAVQVASGQPQQQYVAYSQYHHPSQAAAPNSAAPASYAYEYADPAHTQIYFSQPLAPTMPSQYQTMTGAATEPPSDSMKQQIRTSQPQ